MPLHAATLPDDCLVRNDWVCPKYVSTRSSEILDALGQHVYLTVTSIVIAVIVSFPLALLARRNATMSSILFGAATTVYAIPSLALFVLLVPWTGISSTTVIIGLVLYSLTILIRNILAGLRSVPDDVVESARGMGMGRNRLLFKVELPLALPAIFAGLRVATVSTVALVTIGAILGYGGLGNAIYSGLRSNFKSEVLTNSVLCVVLAIAADLLLIGLLRVLTPWQRGRAAS